MLRPPSTACVARCPSEPLPRRGEKFEIARQLDDATSREQSVRERAEAAHSRTEAVEQRHRDCLKELAEANADRQRMRAQQSDAASEHMEQRLQEAKEQQKKELELQSAKMEKDCRAASSSKALLKWPTRELRKARVSAPGTGDSTAMAQNARCTASSI